MIKETNNLLFNLSKMWYNQHRIKEVKEIEKSTKRRLINKNELLLYGHKLPFSSTTILNG